MKNKLLLLFDQRILSPWWIFSIDLLLTSFAFLLAYVLRMNINLSEVNMMTFILTGTWSVATYAFCFLCTKSYRGVIRHTDLGELFRLLSSNLLAVVLLFGIDYLSYKYAGGRFNMPDMVIVLQFIFTFFFLTGFRMLVRETYSFISRVKVSKRTLIYGAGDLGLLAVDLLSKMRDDNYNVVGFIDDDKRKWMTPLRDVQVQSFSKALETGIKKGVTTLVIAIANLSKEKKQEITERCFENNWDVKVLPTIDDWIEGKVADKSVRDVKIEDLLGRDQIKLDLNSISESLTGKIILVSGAAGSIGSEIVRQLLRFPVGQLILLDQAESALYDLQQEIITKHGDEKIELVVADISNAARMRTVFEKYCPHVVFNAAAYKHVPMMEANPYEALNVNVGGTRNLANLAVEFGVEKFVMISTDKAVNPTNVMGASKRMCEIYIQSLAQRADIQTSFITTRFGNVLGSNGSVVPLFKKQIEQGGPVKVTHPDITRYFMTIPEACQLVLEAGAMGKGGEIFVFDMGEPVKILDLAKKMIRLAGLKLDQDIKIEFSGLRPGEKLYEELLASSENTLPTYNEKIMIGKVRLHNYDKVNRAISLLLANLNSENNEMMVARMKDLVPEFVSENSIYEAVDLSMKDSEWKWLMFGNKKEKESRKQAHNFPIKNIDIERTRMVFQKRKSEKIRKATLRI
ncbi:polysaccharide biosynthesis protein [Labilibaculum antarcticum]|uniref:Capsule biosynthesis protein CapD n=1 Tax=Labilibaculum antarcticum TaxID=1717717 RepID=A0A1Y1CQ99_9BACT|nr:nucleoside-diphosphate sugar epimerase/dehydratase [Labilibaculum antarcticum]BAX82616.1 capsule biosynthesis protein CapD [Labilibaculum antarcticum]